MKNSIELFGKYFIIDRIAVGGMAEIFRAKTIGAEGFEKVLVIKRILPHLSYNQDFVRMFTDEAKIAVQLSHSNIVHVYDFGRINRHYYIAMEYVEGKDVRTIMRRCSAIGIPFSPEYSLYIVHEVLKGLEYAHNRVDSHSIPLNVIHRDISPGNILVSYEGEIKIADFGIAKAKSASFQTKDGVLKGKFEYMSPEQAGGEDIDRRSDIFSTGVILWELLTGKRLFKTESETKTLEKIKKTIVEVPSKIKSTIPADLDNIVMKALAKNPANRYQSAEEMRREIVEFLYPSSVEMIQMSLSTFLKKHFEEEIKMEREALERAGSAIKRLMNEGQLPHREDEIEPSSFESLGAEESFKSPALSKPSKRGRSRFSKALFLSFFALFILFLSLAALLAYSVITMKKADRVAEKRIDAGVSGEVEEKNDAGTLFISVTPPDSTLLSVDEKDIEGSGEWTIHGLEPLVPHTITIRKEGYEPITSTVTLNRGEKKNMEFLLSLAQMKTTERKEGTEKGKQGIERVQPRRSETSPTPKPVVSGAINFESNPKAADVIIDGEYKGKTPFTFREGVANRRYEVTISLEGYQQYTTNVVFPAGTIKNLRADLIPLPQSRLVIFCEPYWAKVIIDGKDTGKQTPPTYNERISPGIHTITLFNPDLNIKRVFEVEVKPGETERLNVNLLSE